MAGPPHAPRLAALIGVAGLAASCGEPADPWYAELQPDSPCYRVDLSDGLSEDDTTEVQDTFSCLDHHGHLASLRPTAAALEAPSDAGVPAGIELARTVNALPRADVDPLAMLGSVVTLLRGDPAVSTHAQDVVLELIVDANATTTRRLDAEQVRAAIRDGALARLGPAIPGTARAVLDDDLQATALLADALEDPETHRWIWTVEGWIRTEHPDVAPQVDGLLPHLGEAIVAARSPDNDRWRGASGDSLRDLLDVATASEPDVLDQASPGLSAILGDRTVRAALPDLLVDLERDGHLGVTPAQMTWLTLIDREGGRLSPGEDSAMTSLLRLLHRTNRPVRCEVDLWLGTVELDVGNLAVNLLRILADQDPDAVQSAASLMGDVLGYGGSGVLEAIADTGVCDGLDRQVVADLPALDRLGEPQSRGLTHTLIGATRVLRDGDEDHVEDLVDLISIAWRAGLVPPLEEALRDMGEGEVGEDLVALVPVMDRPDRYGVTAREVAPATLEDLLDQARWLVDRGEGGRTGWERLQPLLSPSLDQDGTWEAVHVLGRRLADRSGATGRALDLVPPLLDADPELTLLTGLAPAIRDRAVVAPALRLAATEPVVGALLAAEPAEPEGEVPLAFGARLIRTGALDDLLAMVRIVLDGLDDVRAPDDGD